MELVTKQILIEENSYSDASHIALIGDSKEKKSSQGPSTDSNTKKKNMKCYYYKKKEHVKSEYRCHDLAKRLSHYLYFFFFFFFSFLIGLTTTRWSMGKYHVTLSQSHNWCDR